MASAVLTTADVAHLGRRAVNLFSRIVLTARLMIITEEIHKLVTSTALGCNKRRLNNDSLQRS